MLQRGYHSPIYLHVKTACGERLELKSLIYIAFLWKSLDQLQVEYKLIQININ